MRILIANVNDITEIQKSYGDLDLPVSINILASITPKRFILEILNYCMFKNIDFNKEYDLVALSFLTDKAVESYRIADEFRKRGITVVLGGWHSTAIPEEAKQHADSVVIGEAEETWPQLLKDFENDRLKPFYFQKKPADPKDIPILKNLQNNRLYGVLATRGCPVGCEFCCITHSPFRNVFRTRLIEDVIEEIKALKQDNFAFYDNSLTINTSYSKQLFREMQDLNKKFVANGNINILAKDEEFLRLARDAGCMGWFIGFESVNQKSLDNVGKKTNKILEYSIGVKRLHEYDMHVNGSFIFGFDTDTLDIFDKTYDMINQIEIDNPVINILIPYPGTPLFERYKAEGRLLTYDWSKYNNENVVFKPKNMSPQELLRNARGTHKKLYTYPKIITRTFKSLRFGFHNFLQVGQTNLLNRY